MGIIQIQDLEKTYPGGTRALRKISFAVEQGDFYGLLGPNGAGKSTAIGVLTGLVNKTSGKVIISGIDIDTNFPKARSLLGVVPQEVNLNIFERCTDIVVQQAGYYGVPRRIAEKRTEKLLRQLGIWEQRDKPSRELSGGMKRRLMIARALVHQPKILILDEPTAGVDVNLRRGMLDFLKQINKRGTTIILTTHYLEEAEELCNRIGIIDKGTIIRNTTKRELLEQLDVETFVLYLKTPLKSIRGLGQYHPVLVDDKTLEVQVSKGDSINAVFQELTKRKVAILSMRNKVNRLEELFVRMTGGGE